jgi:hypothetical protein
MPSQEQFLVIFVSGEHPFINLRSQSVAIARAAARRGESQTSETGATPKSEGRPFDPARLVL